MRLGFGATRIGPFVLPELFGGPGALVYALCSASLRPVGCVLLLEPSVLPFPVGRAGLLARRAPRALGLHRVLRRPGGVRVLLGGLPRAGGAMVPLSLCLLVHVLQGPAGARLCLPGAGRALGHLGPVFRAFLGTGGFGVPPAGLPAVGTGAGGGLVGLVSVLLSSRPVRLPGALLSHRPPPARPQEVTDLGGRRGHFRGREVNGGWGSWR